MNASQPASPTPNQITPQYLKRLKDLVITLLLWGYFIAGFAILFGPFYLAALSVANDRNSAFQRLNQLFFNSFFKLCRFFTPSHKWSIAPAVSTIQSSIIVCNHISYLDSILLVSLYPKHTTIAKDRLFYIPILGSVAKHAGYIPSSGRGRCADLLINSLEAISTTLERGGNVIVFPEGTRSRDGRIGALQKGAFKIAKYCKAPIKILHIKNTHKLFPPGKFLFNTCIENTISLQLVGELTPQYETDKFNTEALMAQVRELLGRNKTGGISEDR